MPPSLAETGGKMLPQIGGENDTLGVPCDGPEVQRDGICAVLVDPLPLFPYNRGWETQPKSGTGFIGPHKDSLFKVG